MDEPHDNLSPADEPVNGSDGPLDEDPGVMAGAGEPDHKRPLVDIDRPYRVAVWLLVVGTLVLAGFLFAIPAHVYDRGLGGRVIPRIRRMDVVELWRVQSKSLPGVGRPELIEALFVGCSLVFVVGTAYMIWIAMVDVRPTSRQLMGGAGSAGESESV